jgi:hypothetical protein
MLDMTSMLRKNWLSLLLLFLLFAGTADSQPFFPGKVNVRTVPGDVVDVNCLSGCGGGGAVTANQGTANTQANRWPVFWSDGTGERGLITTPIFIQETSQIAVSQGSGAAGAGWRINIANAAGSALAGVTSTGLHVAQGVSLAVATTPWVERLSDGTVFIGSGGTGTGLTVTCTNCGGAVEGQTYTATVLASAAAASKDHLNIFNAAGSGKVLKILSITAAPQLAATVTGVLQSFLIQTTSTAGVTCTALTIRLEDTNNAAVPGTVTANTNCTTDPTSTFDWIVCSQDGEEARSANSNDGNCYRHQGNGGQPKTLREGQGLSVRSTALSGAWPVHVHIRFTM